MRRALAGAGIVMSLAVGCAEAAQAPAAGLPTGEAVIARYVDATGGRAAYAAIRNRVVHGTMEIPSAGVAVAVTVFQAKPSHIYTVVESGQSGRIESGVADGVAWEISPQRGAIVKEGQERADALRDAAFDRLVDWQTTFTRVECVGVEDVDGKPAYRVVLTARVGSPVTADFDCQSGLVVKVQTVVESEGQKAEMAAWPSDYRQVDGIRFAFVTTVNLLGERIVRVDRVEQNVQLPDDRFALPPAIAALVHPKWH